MAGDLSLNEQIRNSLCRFCQTVRRRNERVLFDLTRQGEDVACRLLNLKYGGDLINLNREWPNCPAIDLADGTRRICVQVTAIRKAVKANKAAERLQRL